MLVISASFWRAAANSIYFLPLVRNVRALAIPAAVAFGADVEALVDFGGMTSLTEILKNYAAATTGVSSGKLDHSMCGIGSDAFAYGEYIVMVSSENAWRRPIATASTTSPSGN